MSVELTEELKREIGQHFVFGFHGHELSDDIKVLIRDYHLGNVILMKRNVQSVHQVQNLVCDLQQFAKDSGHAKPLLIGIDQENGLVSAFSSTATYEAGTQFPGAMALAATGSIDLAERVSAATGRELRLAGINWAYSPVADVNSDPRNPVIGVRSFGDDPHEVGQYATAVSRGLTSAGVAPSAKHFPGHGDTHVDSHLALPRILKNNEELSAIELVPFKALVDDGIATIMTSHVALPLVTGDDTPSSLSRTITTDLLRGKLGFEGVIVTDCLEMDAIAEGPGCKEGAVLSLQAGADIVMICHKMERQRGAIEETYRAIQSGLLSANDLKVSGQNISKLKDQFAGTWEEVLTRSFDERKFSLLKTENATLSYSAYKTSIAVIGDPSLFRSLEKKGTVLVFTPEMQSLNKAVDDAEGVLRTAKGGPVKNTAGPSYLALAGFIAARVSSEHIVYSPDGDISVPLEQSIRSASSVIFTTRNADRSAWQISYLRNVIEKLLPSTPMILLASCAPYDLLNVDIRLPCVASFEFTPSALEAAVAVIFGERPAKGRIPVMKGKVVG